MDSSKQQSAPVIGKPAAENLYMQLNESELAAIIMKGSPNSNDRDAGFCSGSSEVGDDLSSEHARLEQSSSIEISNDSLEVKIMPISLVRNKRKSSEPSKVVCDLAANVTATVTATATNVNVNTAENVTSTSTTTNHNTLTSSSTGPLKKRIRYISNADSAVVLTPTSIQPTPTPTPPLQLWDSSQVLPHELMPNPAQIFVRHPGVTTLHRMPLIDVEEQLEPLALVSKKHKIEEQNNTAGTTSTNEKNNFDSSSSSSKSNNNNKNNNNKNLSNLTKSKKISPKKLQTTKLKTHQSNQHQQNKETVEEILTSSIETNSTDVSLNTKNNNNRPQQRNYKNMTRERRIEANARERTRVHTISAAYETLRHAVPSYSNAQKLSKLSVLRVACSYILTLSRMAGHDYSADQSEPSISSCCDAVTSTIMTEGKIRKKKDD